MSEPLLILVEDDADLVTLTQRALASSGLAHQLLVAHSGVEAIECFDQWAQQPPELVLLDIQLGAIDGFEVIRQLREHPLLGRVPVAVLTSSNEQSDVARAYQLGANSYLRKPISYAEYRELLVRLVRYWLVDNIGPSETRI